LDKPGVEELLVHRSLASNGGFEVSLRSGLELDPHIAVRVLLNVNFVNWAEAITGLDDLVLDVDEEGGVFAQIHLLDFKHVRE